MITHVAAVGDCIASIAESRGLFWQTVWDHPANAALKQRRGDPNLLAPGDAVVVPDKRQKPFARATGARHRFRLRNVPAMLRLRLNWDEQPRANEDFVLVVDGIETRGRTDADGALAVPIDPRAKSGVLVIGAQERRSEIHITLGALDPVDTVAGALQRLRSLALYDGPDRSELNDAARSALRAFQAEQSLSTNGELDDPTRARLRQVHDGV